LDSRSDEVFQVLNVLRYVFDPRLGHKVLLRVKGDAKDVLVLLNGDDFNWLTEDPQCGSLSVSLILDDVELTDVAAGDGSVEELFQRRVVLLVDRHRAPDSLPSKE